MKDIAELKDLFITRSSLNLIETVEPSQREMDSTHRCYVITAVKRFAQTENNYIATVEDARTKIFESISEFFDTEEGVRDCK